MTPSIGRRSALRPVEHLLLNVEQMHDTLVAPAHVVDEVLGSTQRIVGAVAGQQPSFHCGCCHRSGLHHDDRNLRLVHHRCLSRSEHDALRPPAPARAHDDLVEHMPMGVIGDRLGGLAGRQVQPIGYARLIEDVARPLGLGEIPLLDLTDVVHAHLR